MARAVWGTKDESYFSITFGPNFFLSTISAWKWHKPNRIPCVLRTKIVCG